MKLIGFEISKIEYGSIEGILKIEQQHLQQHGFLHGGVMTTCLDIVMGFAAYTHCAENQAVVTADIHVDFLNPGDGTHILVKGNVFKSGRKLIFCEGKIECVKNDLITLTNTAKSIMCIIDK